MQDMGMLEMSIGVFLISLGGEFPKKSSQRGKVGPKQRDFLHRGPIHKQRPRVRATEARRPCDHGISSSVAHHLDQGPAFLSSPSCTHTPQPTNPWPTTAPPRHLQWERGC